MFKKIVVGMDLSEASVTALEEIMPIARHCGAEVVMVHAGEMLDSSDHYPWISQGMLGRYKEMIEGEQAKTRARLDEIRERLSGQGVTLSHSLIAGFAENALAKAAKELGADLLVVGSHGRTGFDHFLLGSVAERVSRFTATDVLVSRARDSKALFQRILVPIDFSSAAARALDVALELAAPDSRITLLHCWRLPGSLAGYSRGDLGKEIERASKEQLEAAAGPARERRPDLTIDVRIASGYAPDKIRELSEPCDLIAMGSHGRRGFRRFFLGSVAEKVVRHAACSVYIARATDDDEEA